LPSSVDQSMPEPLKMVFPAIANDPVYPCRVLCSPPLTHLLSCLILMISPTPAELGTYQSSQAYLMIQGGYMPFGVLI